MKYNENIDREVRLEEQDFIDLFRNQETTDDGSRVYIKKLDFIRALGHLDSSAGLTEEERSKLREHQTPDVGVIESEPVPEDDTFDDE